MTVRTLALVLAAVLAVPALLLLRPTRGADGGRASWLSLDGVWTLVPVALLAALIALAAAA